MDILNKLQNIFREIFDDENLVLSRETSANDIEEWDSLAQINIIESCGTEFETKFDLNDITKLKNVEDMVILVEKKLNEKCQ